MKRACNRVLSKHELNELLKVKTTMKQARQIIRRNSRALEILRSGVLGHVPIGCPHCEAVETNCTRCAYHPEETGTSELSSRELFTEFCLEYTFGGIRHREVCRVIGIRPSHMHIIPDIGRPEIVASADIWLRGHIEWAEAVLKRRKK